MGPGGPRAGGQEDGWRVRCQVEKDRVTLPPSQQEPSQGDLVAEEDPDPLVSGGGCWPRAARHGKCVPAEDAGCAPVVPAVCGGVHQPCCGAWVREREGDNCV